MLRTLALALLGAPAVLAQATVHVDAAHVGPSDGSAAAPYRTIDEGLGHPGLTSGDVVLVAPGTYVETVSMDVLGVQLVARYGPTHTRILAPAGAPALVVAETADYVSRIAGFTLEGNGSSVGIQVSYVRALTVEGCVVRGHHRGLSNRWDLFMDGCTVTGNVYGLEHLGGGHGADAISVIEDTLFTGNTQPFTGTDVLGTSFSITTSLWTGDALFVAPPADVHLQAASPARDAGDPTETDPDGTRRDIGAVPYDPSWPLGEATCAGTRNSTGETGRLRVTGSASLAANDLVLRGDRLTPFQAALPVFGTERDALPLNGGTLCLNGRVVRLSVTFTDAIGRFATPFDAGAPPFGPPITAGETLHFQVWHRDFAAPYFTGLSNGVQVTFAP